MEDKDKIDWSRFTVSMPLNLDQGVIIKAWTSQVGLEEWFLKLAEFTQPTGNQRNKKERIQPGDAYKWTWHGWPDSIVEIGEVLPCKEGEFIRFTFGKTGTVSVKIIYLENETILQLIQENIPQDEASKMNIYVGCKSGWTFYLLNLKSFLLGGPDLRNKNNKLQMD